MTVAWHDWIRGSDEQDVVVSTVSMPATKVGLAAVRYLLPLPPESVTPAIAVVPEMTISAVGSGRVGFKVVGDAVVGLADGIAVVGLADGPAEGLEVGNAVVGLPDGIAVVGLGDGPVDGVVVGGSVIGLADGLPSATGDFDGLAVAGELVGDIDGPAVVGEAVVGLIDGVAVVGATVGSRVGGAIPK